MKKYVSAGSNARSSYSKLIHVNVSESDAVTYLCKYVIEQMDSDDVTFGEALDDLANYMDQLYNKATKQLANMDLYVDNDSTLREVIEGW